MKKNTELLGSFTSMLPRDLRHILEFRSAGWHEEGVYFLLRKYNVAFCIHDMAKSKTPIVSTTDFTYLLFHGTSGRYAGSYTEEELRRWAESITGLDPAPKAVYAYFNNDVGGHAVSNARTLREILKRP